MEERLNVAITLIFLLAYPDSARLAGMSYGGVALGEVTGGRVSARDSMGRLHIVYGKNWGSPTAESSDIYHIFSTDDGLTWSPQFNVSRDGDSCSSSPSLAVDPSGGLHCVWYQFDGTLAEERYDYYYSRNSDSGWSAPVNISRLRSLTNAAPNSSICVDRHGTVRVAFEVVLGAMPDIYYTYGAGDTWATPQLVSNSPYDDGFPSLGADSQDNLHLCWRIRGSDSGYIMYARRDSGWSAPRRIAAAPHGVNCQSLAVGPDDRVHVVYTGDIGNGNLHVFYLHSDGDSWTTPIDISSGAPASTYSPSIAVDSSNIMYAVWEQEWPLVQRELMLSVYDGVWHTPINLTLDSVHGVYSPHLGVPPGRGRVDLCWVGTTTERTYPVYYMRLAAVRADVAESGCGGRSQSGIAVEPTVFHERLRLTIPPGARGPVSVLDAAGRLVRVLSPRVLSGRPVEWDSRDDRGFVVRKGVYFIHTGEGQGGTRTKVVRL